MRFSRESVLGTPGQANCYHVISRVVDRKLVFGDDEKEFFRSLLEKQLRFSGLRCLAWCFMGNHFHLLLEVPDKEAALKGVVEEELFGRLSVLSSEIYTRRLLADVSMWRKNGNKEGVEKAAEAVRARLFDLSRFMQEFKSKFTMWFNRRHGRRGTLWEERFKSLLVEGKGGTDGPEGLGGLLAVAAYIDLNPVRAGLCDDPKDYRWCSYAEAVAGGKAGREGMARCVGATRGAAWRSVARAYRLVIFGAGEAQGGAATVDGMQKRRRGFTQKQIDRVIAKGGSLPLADVLRCRVRYFTDGVALGSKAFLQGVVRPGRDPADVAGADLGGLAVASRLRDRAICAPG